MNATEENTQVDEEAPSEETRIEIPEQPPAIARRLRTYSDNDEESTYDTEAPTALAIEMTPSSQAPSIMVTAPPGSKPGDRIIIDGRQVEIPPGIEPGDSFVLGQRAPVIARPAPEEQRENTQVQRQQNLSLMDQRLLNFRWSTKCFTAFDVSTSLLLALYGSWSIAALIFLIGPIYGYVGARDLSLVNINRYLIFSILKIVYIIIFIIFRSYLAFFYLNNSSLVYLRRSPFSNPTR
mmetsp:Transcript_22778/g.28375  ORF Transcript_22778/g.28375 Transcript_22778/m.28375 type:complete len:237 (+) Transcript_22778:43-753(+)